MVQGPPIVVRPTSLQNFKATLLRPEDLLYLNFEFINLTLQTGPQVDSRRPRLTRLDANKPAYIVVYFPAQHLAEQAFFESSTPQTSEQLLPPPIKARIARNSRLVFKVPPEITEIPYTTESLLDWLKYQLSVVVSARTSVPIGTKPTSPASATLSFETQPPETAIELPYRLILSPNEQGCWLHSADPVTHDGRTELWHTRFAERRSIAGGRTFIDQKNLTLRAVWATDPNFNPTNPLPPVADTPFLTSLTANDRHQLVRLTSDYSIVTGSLPTLTYYKPPAIQVERLMLSSLGGWLRSRWLSDGANLPAGLSISDWRHIATMGRDNYVRVVYEGYLYPFGHRAALIKITERKFQPIPGGGGAQAAYLRQREYIVVREPEKVYRSENYAYQGREMPFQSIRLTTLSTPALDLIQFTDLLLPNSSSRIFWVRVNGTELPFHIVATDVEGQTSEFTAALIFVEKTIKPGEAEEIRTRYLSVDIAKPKPRNRCLLNGQKVAFAKAPQGSSQSTTTTLHTEAIYFYAQTQINSSISLPPPYFLPRIGGEIAGNLMTADVRIPAIEQLLGTKQTVAIRLYRKYLRGEANAVQVFATVESNLRINNLSADKAGGLVTLNTEINGLSQTLGPIAGNIDQLATGIFGSAEIADILGDNKLLGCVDLKNLVKPEFNLNQLPQLLSRKIEEPGKPAYLQTELSWVPAIQSVGPLNASDASLTITARTRKQLGDAPPETRIYGKLSKFRIIFSNIIEVKFDALEFIAQQGKKLDVNADINDFQFQGALSFINDLRRYIPKDGFSDPPSLDVSPRGVDVGYSLGLPPVAVGVFSLQNISLAAGLFLPFNDEPARLSFAFSERHRPFLLSVLIFGGGGYFGIQTGLNNVLMMEGALEFGGVLELNLGVASGGIQAMAGIYFQLAGDQSALSGYLRITGALQILGLICVSVEFYMELSYDINRGVATGSATVTVKVEVFLFEKSVRMTVRKEFAGSAASAMPPPPSPMQPTARDLLQPPAKLPVFTELLSQQDWNQYCTAFA